MEVEKRLIKFVNEVEETLDFFKDSPNHVFDGNELAVDAIKHELEDLRKWEEETAMEILNKKRGVTTTR